MTKIRKNYFARKIILYEIASFLGVVCVIWLDEILDMPHVFWGAQPTPINWSESLFESLTIVLLGTFIINLSIRLFRRMRHLEGILPMCASCKKIRDSKGYWRQVEAYIEEFSDASFSHSLCADCSDKLYGAEPWYKKRRE